MELNPSHNITGTGGTLSSGMTCFRVTPFSGTISPEWVAQVRAVYPYYPLPLSTVFGLLRLFLYKKLLTVTLVYGLFVSITVVTVHFKSSTENPDHFNIGH